ncbi:hypothetical protein VKT23_020654 [Stygiomarasmius scandens]|uniref:Membrane-associated proteins in eicosanoid and glutathione metabolism n=1 Tax=Marasmiellus scandens TaxID=2682957 RepID=A0ABR1IIM5_9AGAR
MSSLTVSIPKEFAYVGAALVSTAWLLAYQTIVVDLARHKSGIKYPQLYAEKEEAEKSFDKKKFNCAQRAHQNTLEQLPLIYVSTLAAGIKYPTFAAAACGIWVLSRVLYTRGYASGYPERRTLGSAIGSALGAFPLLFTATYVAGNAVYSLLC